MINIENIEGLSPKEQRALYDKLSKQYSKVLRKLGEINAVLSKLYELECKDIKDK